MANLIIKPTSGGSLILQDEGGTAANTIDASGNTTLAGTTNNIGTVTGGTISTGAVIDDPTMTQGSDATGDVYYRAANGKLTRLPTTADGQVLTSTGVGAVPAWEAAAGSHMVHITTIDLETGGAYTNTAGGTANAGTVVLVANLLNQSSPNNYKYWEIYLDGVSSTVDSEFRIQVVTGTNGASGDLGSVMGYITHTTPSGLTIGTAAWYQGTHSGPDQDGNFHNTNSTSAGYWAVRAVGDLTISSDQIIRLNTEVSTASSRAPARS